MKALAFGLSLTTTFIALAALIGYAVHYPNTYIWLPGSDGMALNTAFCLLFLGVANMILAARKVGCPIGITTLAELNELHEKGLK